MSEFLKRIDARLGLESDPAVRGILLAQRAIYLARVGHFIEANEIVTLLRGGLRSAGMERVAIWVMLVEGVVDQYERLGARAYDRVQRAQALSIAFNDPPLIAVTSAWRAYLEFEESRFVAAADALSRCFDNLGNEDNEAATRAAMVLTYGFTYCGQRDAAQHWFRVARHHALTSGDQAAIEGLMHNRASFGLAWSRIQQCYGRLTSDYVKVARSEIESAKNFKNLVNLRALSALTDLCIARVLLLEQRFEDAVIALRDLRDEQAVNVRDFKDGIGALEVAYCLAKLGRRGEAEQELVKIGDFNFPSLDIDDRLLASWLIVQIGDVHEPLIGDLAVARARLEERMRDYEVQQSELSAALSPFLPVNS
jgi:tetratricopeptide (TPR) repeat protein